MSNFINRYTFLFSIFLLVISLFNVFSFLVHVEAIVFFIMTIIFFLGYLTLASNLNNWLLKEKLVLYHNYKLLYVLKLLIYSFHKHLLTKRAKENLEYIRLFKNCDVIMLDKFQKGHITFRRSVRLHQLERLYNRFTKDILCKRIFLSSIVEYAMATVLCMYLFKLCLDNVVKNQLQLSKFIKEICFYEL